MATIAVQKSENMKDSEEYFTEEGNRKRHPEERGFKDDENTRYEGEK